MVVINHNACNDFEQQRMTKTSFSCSPRVLKFYEGKGRSLPVLEIDEDDLAVLVEEVLYVLGSDVGREVPHVDPRLVLSNLGHDEFHEEVRSN